MIGKCNCGSVQFELLGKVPGLYKCHCSLCRKQSGCGSNAATIVKSQDFEWVSGVESVKAWRKATGFNSHFCSECGSPVPNPIMGKQLMWIPVGLLSNPDTKIVAHLWLESKESWDAIDDASKMYQGMPENLVNFVDYLYANTST